jgi:hypothetical protein
MAVLCLIGLLCAMALLAFRSFAAGRYHVAPDPAAGRVKPEEA